MGMKVLKFNLESISFPLVACTFIVNILCALLRTPDQLIDLYLFEYSFHTQAEYGNETGNISFLSAAGTSRMIKDLPHR